MTVNTTFTGRQFIQAAAVANRYSNIDRVRHSLKYQQAQRAKSVLPVLPAVTVGRQGWRPPSLQGSIHGVSPPGAPAARSIH
ncbi:MAG: hypothetical protein Q7V56_16085 [Gammaproteobacteria bacterium]|nr:hypothetical protein [Gammaproteobacteria bacterium]